MKLNSDQLEWIVQEVMRRLKAHAAEPAEPHQTKLELHDRVVCTQALEGRLGGTRVVQVHAKAVVTPAAKDLLRDHGVQLIRSP